MTQVFAIIGDPIAQVRSPTVFNELFEKRGIDAVMVPMHIVRDDLEATLASLRKIQNMAGVMITVPHKPLAAASSAAASNRARIAGAANALRPMAGGWEADLLDGEGFAIGLEHEGFSIQGKQCAIVGAGGAGAAIALALADRTAASVSVWDVDIGKAEELASRMSCHSSVPMVVGLPTKKTDVVVNATPLGMVPSDELPIDLDSLGPYALVAEAIMKPPVTRLLIEAEKRGHKIHEGRHMLDYQMQSLWDFFGLPV